MKRTGGLHLICSQPCARLPYANCRLYLVSLRLYIKTEGFEGIVEDRSRMASSIMENNSKYLSSALG